MPYKDVDSLPSTVKALSEKKQRQFLAVFNSTFEETEDETKAFQNAWASVKKGDSVDWQIDIDIIKKDDEQQIAFGWLSVVIDKAGNVIEDSQGDVIEPEELEKAAYEFVLTSRKAGDMHQKVEGVGRLVESMVFTKEKQKALGIPEGVLPVGWFTGFKVFNAETWEKIKKGEYTAFSIAGRGKREAIDG